MQNDYEINTDKGRLDLALIHDFLSNRSYWAKDIPFELMKKAFDNSLCFGVYHQGKQAGFARVVTDFTTTAYLGDVFILEQYRGKGLAKLLMETIVKHPDLQGLRLWFLGTKDAHGLYERYGFKRVAGSAFVERLMARHDPDAFKQSRQGTDR
jgi:GNAT superfamily N-acetyltransferase